MSQHLDCSSIKVSILKNTLLPRRVIGYYHNINHLIYFDLIKFMAQMEITS